MSPGNRFTGGRRHGAAPSGPSDARRAVAQWLFDAERELRLAFELVQRDGTDGARARYAKARADHDAAFAASTRFQAFPSHREDARV